jgi:hypothetical protein
MSIKNEGARVMLRLPPELKSWLEQQAERNWTSQNAEGICAIRSQMESEQRAAVG